MGKQTITFRLDAEKKKALDIIAGAFDRNRSWALGEAVDSYLETHRWQVDHIKEGLRQAEAGHFAKPADVEKAFAKWRR